MTPTERAKSLQKIAMDILDEGAGEQLAEAAMGFAKGNVPESRIVAVASVLLTDAAASMVAMISAQLPDDLRPIAIEAMGAALVEKATDRANLIRQKEGMK